MEPSSLILTDSSMSFFIICKKTNKQNKVSALQTSSCCPHQIVKTSSEQERPTDPETAANGQQMCISAFVKCTDVRKSPKMPLVAKARGNSACDYFTICNAAAVVFLWRFRCTVFEFVVPCRVVLKSFYGRFKSILHSALPSPVSVGVMDIMFVV